MRWSLVILLLLAMPIAQGYGVVFKSPELNPQYGKVFESVESGKTYVIDIKNDKVTLDSVAFSLVNDFPNAGMTVYSLLTKPDSVPELNNRTYAYIALDYIGFASFDVTKLSFKYGVPKQWLENNTLARNSVSMFYLDKSGFWKEMTTSMTGEDEGSVHYISEGMMHARYFAIGDSKNAVAGITENVELVSAPVNESVVDVVIQEPVEKVPLNNPVAQQSNPVQPVLPSTPAQKSNDSQSNDGSWLVYFLLGVIVVGAVVGFVLWPTRGSVDKELGNYIKESIKRGKTKDEVRERLLEVGWHPDRVEKALLRYK